MNLGCHGFYNHDLRAIYELVNLDVVVEELQRGILVLCCLRPNWPESILSVAFVQVASFVKVGWFVQREFAGSIALDTVLKAACTARVMTMMLRKELLSGL